jgi:hypothetical protein
MSNISLDFPTFQEAVMKRIVFNSNIFTRTRVKLWLIVILLFLVPLISVAVYGRNTTFQEEPINKDVFSLEKALQDTPFFSHSFNSKLPIGSAIISGNVGDIANFNTNVFLNDSFFTDAFSSSLLGGSPIKNKDTVFEKPFRPTVTMEEKPEGYYVKIRNESGNIGKTNIKLKDGKLSLSIENETSSEKTNKQNNSSSTSYFLTKSSLSRHVYLGEDTDPEGMKTEIIDNGANIFIPRKLSK